MKIRNGFVSNSSSSSFLVKGPKEKMYIKVPISVLSKEEVKEAIADEFEVKFIDELTEEEYKQKLQQEFQKVELEYDKGNVYGEFKIEDRCEENIDGFKLPDELELLYEE